MGRKKNNSFQQVTSYYSSYSFYGDGEIQQGEIGQIDGPEYSVI